MIRFIKSADELAHIPLKGKIVLKAAIGSWPAFRHPSRVIGSHGTSFLTIRLRADYDENTKAWTFSDDHAEDEIVVKASDIKAICDTADEVNRVLKLSEESAAEFQKLKSVFEQKFASLAQVSDTTP